MTTTLHEEMLIVGLLACGALASPGCGDDDATTGDDAGIEVPDAALGDAGGFEGPGTCDAPRPVTGIEGTVSVVFDTTDGAPGALDLGEACGNPDADPRAPQEVVAYTVPGAGPHAVSFTTGTDETLTNYDTVIQVLRSCSDTPEPGFPPSCFDEISRTDPRSAGVVMADGGEVLYFVVTGYTDPPAADAIDRGPVGLEITARTNATPDIVAGDVRMIGPRIEVEASGTDADGDGYGLAVTFLGADGAELDVNTDGTVADTLLTLFDAPVSGMTDFTGTATMYAIRGAAGPIPLVERLVRLGVDAARIAVFDEAFATSAEITVPVRTLREVGFGDPCGVDAACYVGMRCGSGGTCEATPEVAAVCGAAADLGLEAPTDTTTTVTRSGTLYDGHGITEGSCGHSPATEAIFDVVVPDMPVDLVASTDHAGTASTDTVVYVRAVCADLSSEPTGGCNDDVASGNARSRVVVRDIAPGTYSVFVETFRHPPEDGGPFELTVSLRPVLAAGASCDPAAIDDRCASGACPPGTRVCP